MARVVVMSAEVQKLVDDAVAEARQKPIPLDFLRKNTHDINNHDISLEERKKFERPPSVHVEIPFGVLAAISFEEQPIGLCKHLSVSIDKPGMVPHQIVVQQVARMFGIDTEKQVLNAWVEEFEPGHRAVNLVAIDTGDIETLAAKIKAEQG